MFFLMSDWLRETVEPCLLPARETEVARDMETASFMVMSLVVDNGYDLGGSEEENKEVFVRECAGYK